MRQVAANLRRLRHDRGLSQEACLRRSQPLVPEQVAGKGRQLSSYAGLKIIDKLAAVLSVEPAELLKPLGKKHVAAQAEGKRRVLISPQSTL
jgi:hypothetical protein